MNEIEKETKYLAFLKGTPKKKTKTWIMTNKDQNTILGNIKWYAPWRKYTLIIGDLVFDENCLREIAEFIEQ